MLEQICRLVHEDQQTRWDVVFVNFWPDSGRFIAWAGFADKKLRSRYGCQVSLRVVDKVYHELIYQDLSDVEFERQHDLLVNEGWDLLQKAAVSPSVQALLVMLRERQSLRLLKFLWTDEADALAVTT